MITVNENTLILILHVFEEAAMEEENDLKLMMDEKDRLMDLHVV